MMMSLGELEVLLPIRGGLNLRVSVCVCCVTGINTALLLGKLPIFHSSTAGNHPPLTR